MKKKAKGMKKKEQGMGEMLDLLKTRPELVHSLIFNPVKVKRLLKSKAARRLVRGVETKSLLKRVAGPAHGPIALCHSATAHLCPGGTRIMLGCGGGTTDKV